MGMNVYVAREDDEQSIHFMLLDSRRELDDACEAATKLGILVQIARQHPREGTEETVDALESAFYRALERATRHAQEHEATVQAHRRVQQSRAHPAPRPPGS